MLQTAMKTSHESLLRLRKHGEFGESYDSVLNKVLDQVENIQRENYEV